MKQKDINVFKLLENGEIEKLITSFYEFSNYGINVYDAANDKMLLTIGMDYCYGCYKEYPYLEKLDRENNLKILLETKQKKEIIIAEHSGFYKSFVPIIYDGNIVFVLEIGLFKTEKVNIEKLEFKQQIQKYIDQIPELNEEQLNKASLHLQNIILHNIDDFVKTNKLIDATKRYEATNRKNKDLQKKLKHINEKLKEDNEKIVEYYTAAQEQKRYYRHLFETTGASTLIIDEKQLIVDANEETARWGYTKEELIGKPWSHFVAPEELAKLQQNNKRRMQGDISLPDKYETVFIHKSGEKRHAMLYSRLIPNTKQVIISILDIHDYVVAHKQLEKIKQQYEIVTNSITDCIFGLDIQGRYTYLNKAFDEITGYSREDFIGQSFVKKLVPKYQKLLVESFEKSLKENKKRYHRVAFYNSKGEEIPIEIQVSNLYDQNNKLLGRAGVFRDIRKQLAYEAKITENKHLYEAVVENINDVVYIFQNGKIVFVNEQMTKLYGYSLKDFQPINLASLFETPEIGKEILNNARLRLQGEKVPDNYVLKVRTKTGQLKPSELSAKLISFEGEKAILAVVRDLSETYQHEQEINKLYTAIQSSPQAIIIASTWGVIQYCNKVVPMYLGYNSYKELLGKHVPEFIESSSRNILKEQVFPQIRQQQFWTGEITLRHKNGQSFPAKVICSTFKNENETQNFIIHFDNISKQKEIEKELILAKQRAEESNRLKSAFLANMNHEIRTPMNAIMGFSDLLNEARTTEERKEFARIINNSSKQLMSLIDDIIYLSKLESEQKPFEIEKVDPVKIMNDVYNLFLIEKSSLSIDFRKTISVKDLDSIYIETNTEKFKQVLSNLVANAIKYTEKGSVEIGVRKEGKTLVFFVKDTGIGIHRKDISRIFDTFYRTNDVVKRAIRGTGLGLSIVKRICMSLEIDIDVKAEYGKGAEFILKLPYKRRKKTITEKIKKIKPEMKNLKVLIAEDEDHNYLFLEVVLKPYCSKIDRAITGKETIEKALSFDYDFILMDLKMPDTDGVEATRKLREQGLKTPIIVQTAFVSEEIKMEVMKVGIDDYVVKPIRKDNLLAVVNRVVSKYQL